MVDLGENKRTRILSETIDSESLLRANARKLSRTAKIVADLNSQHQEQRHPVENLPSYLVELA